MTRVYIELTPGEAKALLSAAARILADEFDGTQQQREALVRARDKLADKTVLHRAKERT